MVHELLSTLEQKVADAVQLIELLRLQIEALEDENMLLKAEHEKWRNDLMGLVHRLDAASVTSETISLSIEA